MMVPSHYNDFNTTECVKFPGHQRHHVPRMLTSVSVLGYENSEELEVLDYEVFGDNAWDKSTFEQLIKDGAHTFGIRDDGVLVASALIWEEDDYTGYLSAIGVHPDYQGMGLGKELLTKTVAYYVLLHPGVIFITLSVLDNSQQLVDFYQSQGWIETDPDEGQRKMMLVV